MNINLAKELVLKAGLKLAEEGLIARTWGNVSCRIDDKCFAVTPSGRSYHSLTPNEIVIVNISDCSYKGDIQPSSEKGIHAEVYKLFPEINFVIHTHQENASIISASSLESIKTEADYSCLGSEIICADYALPGTDNLKDNVIDALRRSDGNAVIMKNHGALCLGADYDEAFKVAINLEKLCRDFIIRQYCKLTGKRYFDAYEMSRFSLSLNNEIKHTVDSYEHKSYSNSKRYGDGFLIYSIDGSELLIDLNKNDHPASEEVRLYNAIYSRYNTINHIIFIDTPEIYTISHNGLELRPVLDDFAQIAGTIAKNADNSPEEILSALKNSSLVLLRSGGALCCGKTEDDAIAVGMVTQKACKAYLGASLFGKVEPINATECRLMRYNYVNKYSKQAELL